MCLIAKRPLSKVYSESMPVDIHSGSPRLRNSYPVGLGMIRPDQAWIFTQARPMMSCILLLYFDNHDPYTACYCMYIARACVTLYMSP